ncbi:hypothetical protein Zmor_024222 [Zophobas morio]|uniref:Peptidase C1A papain C-terminal domain-containing protein n=1 Tax=Zophobas morio TaxID=2755281 RepID=A0AA38HYJ9_9CUCU|nr:hypothetical protein Zmor_024222 [Zophobas morio]
MHQLTFVVTAILILRSDGTALRETPNRCREMINFVNKNRTCWRAGENFPENITMESLQRLNGALFIKPQFRPKVKYYDISRKDIPEFFDASEEWSECNDVIATIRHQGQCGACWAFASTEVMADRLCIATGGKTKFQFSPQDLLECCSQCVPQGHDKCFGGYVASAYKFWFNNGIVSGGDHNDSKYTETRLVALDLCGDLHAARVASSIRSDGRSGASSLSVGGSAGVTLKPETRISAIKQNKKNNNTSGTVVLPGRRLPSGRAPPGLGSGDLETWKSCGGGNDACMRKKQVTVGCKRFSTEAYEDAVGPTSCQQKCHSEYGNSYDNDKKFGSNVYQIDTHEPQIQNEIMTNGPVTAILEVYEDFYNYKSGVYRYTAGKSMGNHAVKIVGWGTEAGIPYWLVANSWGAEWGDLNGFFKILRGQNHCEIEQHITAGKSSSAVYRSIPGLVIFIIILKFTLLYN